MTVENLFTDVLNNLVEAQYESYVFSQKLGERDNNLLPIPTAEIKQITLDINYAYEKKDEIGYQESFDIALIFSKMKRLIKKTLLRYQKKIIDEVDLSPESSNVKWLEIKKNLSSGKLIDFMLTDIKTPFVNELDTLLNKSNEKELEHYQIVANTLIPLAQDTVERNVLNHQHMAPFSKHISLDHVSEKVKNNLDKHIEEIDDSVKSSVKYIPKSINIIVDAQLLKELPPDAIQKAKVVMKMRNIMVERVPANTSEK
ncbi:hypothetical protein [Flavobacterium sp. LC2016-01]|uniref:hypothetical protein n=1 Tax=Flavobacterium sp. LC2016-01 TaxID=2675876 RepID=UPI0012BB0E64|nr:hypothetical protein [Flavobacterium sp. LC2016-01]MTH17157.1 hypothetical protein [Flavobacterium sp. LC2016-01]